MIIRRGIQALISPNQIVIASCFPPGDSSMYFHDLFAALLSVRFNDEGCKKDYILILRQSKFLPYTK
jgi:hypothetical protein